MKRLGGGVQLPNCSGYACEECLPRDSSALKARLTTKKIIQLFRRLTVGLRKQECSRFTLCCASECLRVTIAKSALLVEQKEGAVIHG